MLLLSDNRLPQESEVLRELGDVRRRVHETLAIPEGEREVVVYLFSDRERGGHSSSARRRSWRSTPTGETR